jgi:Flp pilus assembly CpaE family ATPase
MPRTWFSWTDSVLLGSNKLYIVSEMTVPGLRHAKQLVEAIRERLGDSPKAEVIVNRFEQKMFSSGLRKGDIEQVLGDAFAACIPNNYAVVREAIDRGVPLDEVKPGNRVTQELKKLILRSRRQDGRAIQRPETVVLPADAANRRRESGNGRPFTARPRHRKGTIAETAAPSKRGGFVFPSRRRRRPAAEPLLADKLLGAQDAAAADI